MSSERVERRFEAVQRIVEIISESHDWGDQISVLAAVGHLYCGSHVAWKLPAEHPSSPSPREPAELALRKDLFTRIADLINELPRRDRADVLEAAGDILFDTEWSVEDYDEKTHIDVYIITNPDRDVDQ